MNAKELARALAAARAEWELVAGVAFPGADEYEIAGVSLARTKPALPSMRQPLEQVGIAWATASGGPA